MILVQNPLQQLSGNRLIILFFLLIISIFLSSCGSFGKKLASKNPVTNNTKKKTTTSKVDTTQWKKIPEDKFPPITTKKDVVVDPIKNSKSKGLKDSYRIAAFIPLEVNKMNLSAQKVNDLKNLKYLHYYAGLKFAAEDLEKEKIKITIDVFDSQDDLSRVKKILNNQLSSETDVIMGSSDKQILVELSNFGKINEMPVISPWYSSQSITDKNPYYIQLNPFLTEHYRAITNHALAHFSPEQIFLVGRKNSKDTDRFKYFQEAAFEITNKLDALNTFIFDADSLSAEYEIIKEVLLDNGPTVFILPNYSSREEQYIYDVFRRLNVEKGDKEVYVYGMPVLHTMDKISYEYYINLNIRIVMSRFVNENDYKAQIFKARYFNEYNDFPSIEAYEGYDNLMFVGKALQKHGTDFINYLDQDKAEYYSTKFDIKPIYETEKELKPTIDYYENQNLRVIQFINNHFSIVK